MATILVKDGNSADKYIEVDGTGSSGDPYRLKGTNAAAVLTALQAIQTATEALDDTVLPTGAATATLQTTGNTTLTAIDGHVDGIETLIGTTNTTLTTIDGHVDGLETSTASIDAKTPALGQALAAASVPVVLTAAQQTALTPPAAITGFATQTTLASLDTKFPAQGQALSAASTPVVLPAAQITTLTPPAAITGFATQTTLASVDTKIGEVQASPTSNTVLDRLKVIATALAGTLTVATHAVTQSGTWATVATSRAAATANVHPPAANTAAILTYAAAGAGVAHAISGIAWSYSAAPTGGNLKVEDGSGVTVFSVDITAAGPGFIPFQSPLKGSTNTAMIITLAAGGSGVTGKVNTLGKWTE